MKMTNIIRKSLIGVVSAVTLCASMGSVASQPLKASAASYGTRQYAADIANQQIGKHYNDYGFGTHWCSLFATWCAKQSGATVYSESNSCTQMLDDYITKDIMNANIDCFHTRRTDLPGFDWGNAHVTADELRGQYDPNYTPKVGDIALVETSSSFGSDGPDHAVFVVSVTGTGIGARVDTIEGNLGGRDTDPDPEVDNSWKNSYVGVDWWQNMVWGYCSPKYPSDSNSTPSTPSTPSNPSATSVTFNGMSYPTSLRAGSGFGVYGIINSSNGAPIIKVTVDIILDNNNGSWTCVDSTTRTMWTNRFDLHSIDSRIWFNRANIPGRRYMYRVTAWTTAGQNNFERYFRTY